MPNLMGMFFKMTLAGKQCAFRISLNYKWTCAQLCALWKACLQAPPQDVCLASEGIVPTILWIMLSATILEPFSQQCFFFSFFAVEGGWTGRCGGVLLLNFTAIAACFQHRRGHICERGQGQSAVLVKETLPLHKSQQLWSQPKIMPKRLFWNKFSTLDVSCACPLCSIGLYFGEAWVLLSNLLSRLQMKVSGGATHKKLLSSFWSGQIVLTRLTKNSTLSINSNHVW